MNTTYHNFNPEHIPDNEVAYFSLLSGAISSVDDFSYLSITKSPGGYYMRVSLSKPEMTDVLFSQINALNNNLKLRVEYSKSAKKANLFFKITLE